MLICPTIVFLQLEEFANDQILHDIQLRSTTTRRKRKKIAKNQSNFSFVFLS